MHIGDRIARLRKQKGITQEQLADILGTTRQAVSKWEAGKSNPDIDYVIRIGSCFDVSMDHLLLGKASENCGQEPPSTNPRRPLKIICIISLVAGSCLTLLLPLIATLYRNYISNYQPALTNPSGYLSKWPLLGIVLLTFFAIIFGIGGLIWAYCHDHPEFIKKLKEAILCTKEF